MQIIGEKIILILQINKTHKHKTKLASKYLCVNYFKINSLSCFPLCTHTGFIFFLLRQLLSENGSKSQNDKTESAFESYGRPLVPHGKHFLETKQNLNKKFFDEKGKNKSELNFPPNVFNPLHSFQPKPNEFFCFCPSSFTHLIYLVVEF